MRKLFLGLYLLVVVAAFGQNKETSCKIQGHLENSSGAELIIYKFDNSFETAIPVDQKGNFAGTFKLNDPGLYFIKQGKAYSTVFFEKQL